MDELTALREFRPLHELPSATTVETARYALLRHISGRGARSRRLSWKLPAAVATVAAIVVAAVLLSGLAPTSGTEARAASGVLRQTAAVAAGREPVTLPPGAYAYSRSRGVHLVTTVIGGKAFNALVPSVREIWIARDGSGRIRERSGKPVFLTAADRAAWLAAGRPVIEKSGTADDRYGPGGLHFEDLSSLPTDPKRLAETLRQRAALTDVPVDVETFVIVGDLLRETIGPPAVRAALYQVAASLPGVQLVGRVTDPAGRAGIAVAMTSDYSGGLVRHELVFDPRTSALLAERQVLLERVKWTGAPPGTVLGYTVYLRSGASRSVLRPA